MAIQYRQNTRVKWGDFELLPAVGYHMDWKPQCCLHRANHPFRERGRQIAYAESRCPQIYRNVLLVPHESPSTRGEEVRHSGLFSVSLDIHMQPISIHIVLVLSFPPPTYSYRLTVLILFFFFLLYLHKVIQLAC